MNYDQFEIETETDELGNKRVKLLQSIPDRMDTLIKDLTWIKKLLTTHYECTSTDKLVSVEPDSRLEGGIGALAMLFTLTFESGKQQKYVFKCNGDDEDRMLKWNCFREGIWYG